MEPFRLDWQLLTFPTMDDPSRPVRFRPRRWRYSDAGQHSCDLCLAILCADYYHLRLRIDSKLWAEVPTENVEMKCANLDERIVDRLSIDCRRHLVVLRFV